MILTGRSRRWLMKSTPADRVVVHAPTKTEHLEILDVESIPIPMSNQQFAIHTHQLNGEQPRWPSVQNAGSVSISRGSPR
jgi:hypothetical protein